MCTCPGTVATVAQSVAFTKLRPRDTEHRAWDRSLEDAWARGAVSVLAFEILAPNNRRRRCPRNAHYHI